MTIQSFKVLGVCIVMLAASLQSSAQTRAVLIDARKPEGTSEAYQEPAMPQASAQPHSPMQPPKRPEPPIIVRVTGYGAYDVSEAKPSKGGAAKRLMAMRASRLDAYRNMAERVYGLSLSGQSSVKDFAVRNDEFAAEVDSVVRGARVVSISQNPQTGIETVLEIELPADFKRCLNRVNNFRYRADCLRPITHTSLQQQSELANRAARGEQDRRMRTLYHLN